MKPAPGLRVAPAPLKPSGVLRWEDPPMRRSGRREGWWVGVLDELRANPGKWALVLICKSTQAASMKRHSWAAAMREGRAPKGYRPITRPLPDGRGGIYARYERGED